MKFNEAEQKIKEVKHKNFSKKSGYSSEKNIRSVFRYDNLSIILMAPGSKGDFKYLSKLINDGRKQTSWCIRIYYTNGKWGVQLAPNINIDKGDIEINVSELFNKFNDADIYSTLHTGTALSQSKDVIEHIVVKLIDSIRKNELNSPEMYNIDHKYTLKNNSDRFILEYYLSDIKINDDSTLA